MKTAILALVAKVLGRKYDIDITVGGSEAFATSNRINVPVCEGDQALVLARGYIDHEAAHIRHTDFTILNTDDSFSFRLLNILEDVRIEKEIGEEYPGCAVNLRELSKILDCDGAFEPDPNNPATSILEWVMARCRINILSHPMEMELKAAEPLVRHALGSRFRKAERILDQLPTAMNTQDVVDIRDELMKLLQDAAKDFDKEEQKRQEQKQQGEGGKGQSSPSNSDKKDKSGQDEKGGGKGQPEKNNDQSSEPAKPDESGKPDKTDDTGEADKTGTESKEGKPEASDPSSNAGKDGKGEKDGDQGGKDKKDGAAPDSGKGQGQGQDGTAGKPGGDPDNGKGRKGEGGKGTPSGRDNDDKDQEGNGSSAGKGGVDPRKAKAAIEAAAKDAHVGDYGDIGEKLKEMLQSESIATAKNGTPLLPKGIPLQKSGGFSDLSTLRAHTAKLRARLTGLVQASKQKRSTPKRSGARLDKRNLSRLATGDTRLFVRKEEKRDVNTAIVMLLDNSGSMNLATDPDSKISVASRSCYIAAEALDSIPGVNVAAAVFNGFSDTVFPVLNFGEKPDHRKFSVSSSGGTRLGSALWWAWGELRLRQEPRKIVVAFTDGDTGDTDVTKEAIRKLREDGMEVIGIGIQDGSIRRYLPNNSRVIHNLGQLTPALLEEFKNLLAA